MYKDKRERLSALFFMYKKRDYVILYWISGCSSHRRNRFIKKKAAEKRHTHKEVILSTQGGIAERLCRSAFSFPFNGLFVLTLFQFPDKVPDNFNLLSVVSA